MPAGHGLVRVRAALDTHAWAVRAPYFREVRRALAGHFWKEPGTLPAADILLTELAHRLPAYAAHPNIAWQQEEVSDLLGGFAGNYDADGSVRCGLGAVPGLLAEALGGTAWPPAAAAGRACTAWFWPQAPKRHVPPPESPPPPPPLTEHGRVAFLFLTRAEHHLPQVWEHYWQAAGDRVSIHAHTKDRTALRDGGWLARAQISTHLPTEWGQISLVRAMLALLREALAAPENEFFLYASESCLPVRPPADFFHLLSTDGRSRFSWETSAAALRRNPSKNDHPPAACPIPFGQLRFHTQWMLLNREAAELIAANAALIDLFEGGFAPDEYVFGTLLHAAGYPLDQRVAARDLTWLEWPDPRSPHPRSMQELPPSLAGDILASGCCFARKFLPSPETAAAALRLARMAR